MGNVPRRNVVNVILTAPTPRGPITLVLLSDGRYGITRNEQLLPEHHWPGERLDECIDVFLELARDGD